MSVQDARISTSLPSHPKTKKLTRRLGPAAAWHLVRLFLYASANRSDGDLAGMTDEDIELAVDWSGDDGALVAALVEVGFLDGDGGSYRIHDWAKHNPWAAGAEARSEKSRWAALCKQHGRHDAARLMPEYAARLLGTASSKPDAVPDGASGTQRAEMGSAPLPSPLPSPLPFPKQKPIERQAARFAEFWAEYPVKKGRAQALAKWAARKLDAIADRIIADVKTRKATDRQWLDGYIPHGSTYVSGRGWEDEIETKRSGNHAASDAFAVAR